MFETTWEVNGTTLYITSDYLGDESAPFMPDNYHRNEIIVSIDDNEETFYAWGSQVNPQFNTEYSLKNIFQNIVGDALYIYWGQEDELVEALPYQEAKRVVEACEHNWEQLNSGLGLDEATLEEIMNDEEWH